MFDIGLTSARFDFDGTVGFSQSLHRAIKVLNFCFANLQGTRTDCHNQVCLPATACIQFVIRQSPIIAPKLKDKLIQIHIGEARLGQMTMEQ